MNAVFSVIYDETAPPVAPVLAEVDLRSASALHLLHTRLASSPGSRRSASPALRSPTGFTGPISPGFGIPRASAALAGGGQFDTVSSYPAASRGLATQPTHESPLLSRSQRLARQQSDHLRRAKTASASPSVRQRRRSGDLGNGAAVSLAALISPLGSSRHRILEHHAAAATASVAAGRAGWQPQHFVSLPSSSRHGSPPASAQPTRGRRMAPRLASDCDATETRSHGLAGRLARSSTRARVAGTMTAQHHDDDGPTRSRGHLRDGSMHHALSGEAGSGAAAQLLPGVGLPHRSPARVAASATSAAALPQRHFGSQSRGLLAPRPPIMMEQRSPLSRLGHRHHGDGSHASALRLSSMERASMMTASASPSRRDVVSASPQTQAASLRGRTLVRSQASSRSHMRAATLATSSSLRAQTAAGRASSSLLPLRSTSQLPRRSHHGITSPSRSPVRPSAPSPPSPSRSATAAPRSSALSSPMRMRRVKAHAHHGQAPRPAWATLPPSASIQAGLEASFRAGHNAAEAEAALAASKGFLTVSANGFTVQPPVARQKRQPSAAGFSSGRRLAVPVAASGLTARKISAARSAVDGDSESELSAAGGNTDPLAKPRAVPLASPVARAFAPASGTATVNGSDSSAAARESRSSASPARSPSCAAAAAHEPDSESLSPSAWTRQSARTDGTPELLPSLPAAPFGNFPGSLKGRSRASGHDESLTLAQAIAASSVAAMTGMWPFPLPVPQPWAYMYQATPAPGTAASGSLFSFPMSPQGIMMTHSMMSPASTMAPYGFVLPTPGMSAGTSARYYPEALPPVHSSCDASGPMGWPSLFSSSTTDSRSRFGLGGVSGTGPGAGASSFYSSTGSRDASPPFGPSPLSLTVPVSLPTPGAFGASPASFASPNRGRATSSATATSQWPTSTSAALVPLPPSPTRRLTGRSFASSGGGTSVTAAASDDVTSLPVQLPVDHDSDHHHDARGRSLRGTTELEGTAEVVVVDSEVRSGVRERLAAAGLGAYASALIRHGFDSLQRLAMLDAATLAAIEKSETEPVAEGFPALPVGHRMHLLQLAAQAGTDSTSARLNTAGGTHADVPVAAELPGDGDNGDVASRRSSQGGGIEHDAGVTVPQLLPSPPLKPRPPRQGGSARTTHLAPTRTEATARAAGTAASPGADESEAAASAEGRVSADAESGSASTGRMKQRPGRRLR